MEIIDQWVLKDDLQLIRLVKKKGYGNWEAIIDAFQDSDKDRGPTVLLKRTSSADPETVLANLKVILE